MRHWLIVWRNLVVGGAVVVGMGVGFGATSIGLAANSEDCAFGSREVRILPPGMRCGGPKDDWYDVPWDTQHTSPFEPVLLSLAGAGLGAIAFGLPARRLVRGPRTDAPSA